LARITANIMASDNGRTLSSITWSTRRRGKMNSRRQRASGAMGKDREVTRANTCILQSEEGVWA
jgi:hypothetical protein